MKGAGVRKDLEETRGEQWQGRLLTQRWEDEEVGEDCCACMTDWKSAPTHIIAGMNELYQQINQRRSTTRAKQGLRRDIMSCVGCVARFRKPKHMYLQGVVNWPIQSTSYVMLQPLRFSFMRCRKTWTWRQPYHHVIRWNHQNHFTRMTRERRSGTSQHSQRT